MEQLNYQNCTGPNVLLCCLDEDKHQWVMLLAARMMVDVRK